MTETRARLTGTLMVLLVIGMVLLPNGDCAAQNGPRIQLSEETFDFGYTPEGLKANHRYWLWNAGTDTLVIQRVRPTCGCTTVPLPKDRLAPSDSVPLDLVFDTQKFTGKVHKAVRILSNETVDGDTSTTTERKIYFMATVASEDEYITVSPQTAYLDTIGKYEQVLTVVNRDEATYKVSLASPPPDFMEIDPVTTEIPPKGETRFVLKAGDDTPIGIYTGSLTLHFQGPRSFSVTVPIYGMGFQR